MLDQFVLYLESLGRNKKYIHNTKSIISVLINECDWKSPQHITVSSFEDWRSANMNTKSPKTLNEYLSAIKNILNWLCKRNAIEENVLNSIVKVETRGRKTFIRRAFTTDEFIKLLDVTSLERASIYLTAVNTGLRRNEIEQLEWGDIHIDNVQNPFLYARARITKNKKDSVIFLKKEVINILRTIRPIDYSSSKKSVQKIE